MIKLKKTGDNYIAQHEVTGEPIATVRKMGKNNWVSNWHPHVLDMHPHAKDLLNYIPDAETSDSAKNQIESSFEGLSHKQPLRSELERDYDPVNKHAIHFIDNETGKKIFSIHTPNPTEYARHNKYTPGTVYAVHQGTQEGLNIAKKAISARSSYHSNNSFDMRTMQRLAKEHLKTVSGDGPRFIGHEGQEGKSTHHTYKTTIENPAAAISEFIKTAIPNHANMENLTPAGNITLLRSKDGSDTHIIHHSPGLITHTHTHNSPYGTVSPLNKVYEEWAGLDRNPSDEVKAANARLSDIYKKKLSQPMSDYINDMDKNSPNDFTKIKEILHKQNDGSEENKSSLERAKKFIKKTNFNRANT
jgi:hypothetical protein